MALTRIGTPAAGRAYAAYGGVYIAASLMWLWAVERTKPEMGFVGSCTYVWWGRPLFCSDDVLDNAKGILNFGKVKALKYVGHLSRVRRGPG